MTTRQQKEMEDIEFGFQSGFNGTSAINDTTLIDGSTVMGVDTHLLQSSVTLVPVGARFTTAGITTIRTVSATQNSQQWTLDLTAPTAGTFDITLNGATASAQTFNITGAALQTALEALAGIGVGQITVVEAASVHTITFAGTLANIATNTLTVDGSALTVADSHVLINVQTGLVTWEVTFTPAIVAASIPIDDDAISWYPERVIFDIFTGNFEHTENDEPVATTSRNKLDGGIRPGIEQPMSITSAFIFNELRASAGGLITPYEVLHRIGGAKDWLSSSRAKSCSKYTPDLFWIERPKECDSNEEAVVFIFPAFAKQTVSPGIDGGLVNFTGICPVQKPIITRVANNEDAIGVIF